MLRKTLRAVGKLQKDPARLKTLLLRLLLTACLGLGVSLFVTRQQRDTAKQVAKAQSHNVQVLTTQLQTVTLPSGAQLAHVGQLELTIKQLEEVKMLDAEAIKGLKIENKRLLSVGRVEIKTVTKIITQIRDSLIYKDRILIDSVGLINFTDGWMTLKGRIVDRRFEGESTHLTKLSLTEYFTPKRFLFIKYGCKERRFAIKSENPRDSILKVNYSKVIK